MCFATRPENTYYLPDPDIARVPPSSSPEYGTLLTLPQPHLQAFETAVSRVLALPLVENTYAQILDGLPTYDSLRQSHYGLGESSHPVALLGHNEICPEALAKYQEYQATFQLSSLTFPMPALAAFQASEVDTKPFRLRLFELVAVVCHQIAVNIYHLDAGPHKHADYEDYHMESEYESQHMPCPFMHGCYTAVSQYPNDVAECAGYWAEAIIFGGVVVFDRGECETLSRDVYLHPDLVNGRLIFAPTKHQLEQLFALLTGPHDVEACPLPMRSSAETAYLWEDWEAFALHHIFRDRYERKVPHKRYLPENHKAWRRRAFREEGMDVMERLWQLLEVGWEVIDLAEKRQVELQKLRVTPSSTMWHGEVWRGIDEAEERVERHMEAWEINYRERGRL